MKEIGFNIGRSLHGVFVVSFVGIVAKSSGLKSLAAF
jgi:hypothetical protein